MLLLLTLIPFTYLFDDSGGTRDRLKRHFQYPLLNVNRGWAITRRALSNSRLRPNQSQSPTPTTFSALQLRL